MNDSVIRTYKSILLFTNTQIINSSNGTFCIKTLEIIEVKKGRIQNRIPTLIESCNVY